jgi:DNA-binding CsgD family transcriptional regulator
MKNSIQLTAEIDVSGLMDLAGTLRHMSLSPRHHGQISAYIARALELDSLCVAVVRRSANEQWCIETLATYRSQSTGLHPERLDMARRIIQLADSTRPEVGLSACDRPTCSCRHRVIREDISDNHILYFLLHQQADKPPVSAAKFEVLELAARYIAKILKVTLECAECPEKLGKPMARLSQVEWRVLCAMDSEDSEKQLANRLAMSPHTLHSHIKGIYRKIGAGARLQALQMAEEARYQYYINNTQKCQIEVEPEACLS